MTTSTQKNIPAKRLLLVDADHQLRSMLGMMFSDAGYQVLHAANGHEALKIHMHQPVDIVISEVFLPEKDGLETLVELRRQPFMPKFIAMTGGRRMATAEYLRAAQQLGADYVLAKPFEPEHLLATVLEMLGA